MSDDSDRGGSHGSSEGSQNQRESGEDTVRGPPVSDDSLEGASVRGGSKQRSTGQQEASDTVKAESRQDRQPSQEHQQTGVNHVPDTESRGGEVPEEGRAGGGRATDQPPGEQGAPQGEQQPHQRTGREGHQPQQTRHPQQQTGQHRDPSQQPPEQFERPPSRQQQSQLFGYSQQELLSYAKFGLLSYGIVGLGGFVTLFLTVGLAGGGSLFSGGGETMPTRVANFARGDLLTVAPLLAAGLAGYYSEVTTPSRPTAVPAAVASATGFIVTMVVLTVAMALLPPDVVTISLGDELGGVIGGAIAVAFIAGVAGVVIDNVVS